MNTQLFYHTLTYGSPTDAREFEGISPLSSWFIGECQTFYDRTSAAMKLEIKTSAPLGVVIFSIVGEHHAKLFITYAVPSLTSVLSSPSLRGGIKLFVCADKTASAVFCHSTLFKYLVSEDIIKIFTVSDELAGHASLIRQQRGGRWTWEMTYLINCSNYAFNEACRVNKIIAFQGYPDAMYTTTFIDDCFDCLKDGRVAFLPGYRVRRETLDSSLKNRRSSNFESFSIEYREIIKIILDSLEEDELMNNGFRIKNPPTFVQRLGTGFCALHLNLSPIAIKFDGEPIDSGIIRPSLSPTDGGIFVSSRWNPKYYRIIRNIGVGIEERDLFESPHYKEKIDVIKVASEVYWQLDAMTLFSLTNVVAHSLLGSSEEEKMIIQTRNIFEPLISQILLHSSSKTRLLASLA